MAHWRHMAFVNWVIIGSGYGLSPTFRISKLRMTQVISEALFRGRLTSIGIPNIKIRRSWFMIEIPMPGKTVFILRRDQKGFNSLQWRHNEGDGVSNYQPHHCLINCLLRRRSKKTSKLRVTGLCVGNSPVTGEFIAQMASNAENVSI